MSETIVQVSLTRWVSDNQVETMTTWLESSAKLVEGALISLKDHDPEKKWHVKKIYKNAHETKSFDWHRKWDNNI